MIKQFKFKNVTWIDLISPTPEEVASVAQEFGVHPAAASELTNPSPRSKVDLYDDFVFLTLHFPYQQNSLADGHDNHEPAEVDFIVGKNFLITASYSELEPLQEFGKIFEANQVLAKSKKETHAGYLFYYIIKHLYQSLEHNLEFINYHLKKAESKVFAGNEREMVMVLAKINRKLLDFRSTLKGHRQVLVSLEIGGRDFFGDKFLYHLRAVGGEYKKVWYALENSREFFQELKQTNESLLQIKTGEQTKIFTMLAFVTFPLTLVATVMGLGAHGTPFVDRPYGFWIILGLMAAVVLFLMAYFKHRKWL